MIKLTQAEILLIEKLGHKIYTVNYLNWILNDDRLPGSDKPYWHAKGFYDAIQGMAIREAEQKTPEYIVTDEKTGSLAFRCLICEKMSVYPERTSDGRTCAHCHGPITPIGYARRAKR